MTDVILNVASSSADQKMLQDELNTVLAGRTFGDLTQADLVELKKLDSFIKETQRLSLPSPLALTRKIVAANGLFLSNDLYLPRGTYVAMSASSIMRDSDIFPAAEKFDSLRFYKLRQEVEQSTKHQFVSLSDYDINFGAGPGACPGRFLVSYELKIVVAYLLLNFELSLEDDSKNLQEMTKFGTKPGAKIMLQRRSEA